MDKLDPTTDGTTKDIVAENIEKLKALFPDVFTEGKVDFEALQEILGHYVEDRPERYSFTWNGKARARRIAQTPSTGTLRPCPEESVDWDTTQNLFIEGDNLEVLKLLQKAYHKKIKMIYIDPPYNTGNEFIYPDKFQDNIDTYLRYTGQTNEEGFKLSANSETSGRYHTNWLNMMLPRLKLARNLLREDGVICISIDDNEAANLREVCDEIYGEENFLAQLVWKKKYTGGKHTKGYVDFHEYILVYAKAIGHLRALEIARPEDEKQKFVEEDEFVAERGKFYVRPLKSNLAPRPTLVYPIKMPDGSSIETQWLVARDTFEHLLEEKRVELRQKRDGSYQVYRKYYEMDGGGQVKPPSLIEKFPNTEAKFELKELFGITEGRDNVFYTVKPTGLIKHLCEPFVCSQDVVLDFFAGSCATAHAVLSMNGQDGGARRFIMVQLPEPCEDGSEAFKAGFLTIADIGKERIRRVIKKIEAEQTEKAKEAKGKLPGTSEDLPELDLGFKVFKLDTSNIKPWDADSDNLETALFDAVENIKPDRTEADVLYELLLKYGLDLAVPIEERQIAGKTVYIIGAGALIVCLADPISLEVVEGIAVLKEELRPEVMRVVFKDAGFADDVVKTNTVQILRQAGIEDVKSL